MSLVWQIPGTGKTAAFLLPLIEKLQKPKDKKSAKQF